MITSISDIQTYLRCRRQWDYSSSNRRNLTRGGMKAPELELGTLIHAALADWTLDPNNDPVKLFLTHSAKRLGEIQNQYLELVGTHIGEIELAPFYESIDLGRHMIANYKEHYKSPLPDNFNFAFPEQEVIVDIPGTEHACTNCLYPEDPFNTVKFANPSCQECFGSGKALHRIRAILDGLLRSKRGTYVVLERKTFDPRFAPTEDSLQTNFQFKGYTWIVREMGMTPVAGVAYDGLRKQKAPGKTGKATKLADLFVRTMVSFTDTELDLFQVDLANIVNEMANDPIIYPHRPWDGCRRCAFDGLCQSQSRGEDFEHLIRLNFEQRPNTRPILTVLGGK